MALKLDELRILTATHSPDCVAVTETWLNKTIPDSILFIPNYSLFRVDRPDRIGGGVCLYINDKLWPESVEQLSFRGIESITVRIKSLDIFMWCLYIPPSLSSAAHQTILDSMICHFDALIESYSKSNFIICGDFNDFPTSDFRQLFLCINRVESATRGNSFLDQIWGFQNVWKISIQLPPRSELPYQHPTITVLYYGPLLQ